MTRFRKRPLEIEAVQMPEWVDDDAFVGSPQWLHHALGTGKIIQADEGWHVITLEGKMLANHGDWIIRGIAGELYPCKPDIFAATYERIPA